MTNNLPGGEPGLPPRPAWPGWGGRHDSGQRAGYVNGCFRARRHPAAPRCQQHEPGRAGNGPGDRGERTWFFGACGAGRGCGQALRGDPGAGWCRARRSCGDGVWPAGPERGGQDHAGPHPGHAAGAGCGPGGGLRPRRGGYLVGFRFVGG